MQSLKGHLLIATPQLETTIFARSVILMLEATKQAATGIILNQPINTTLTELSGKVFADDFEWNKPISLGGPLASSLMVLHIEADLADTQVIPGVYFTSEPAKVHKLVEQRPEPSIVLANYSAWGPGQLDGELRARVLAHPSRPLPSSFLDRRKRALESRLERSPHEEARAPAQDSRGACGPRSELSWVLDCDRIWAAT